MGLIQCLVYKYQEPNTCDFLRANDIRMVESGGEETLLTHHDFLDQNLLQLQSMENDRICIKHAVIQQHPLLAKQALQI